LVVVAPPAFFSGECNTHHDHLEQRGADGDGTTG
jgi:hypothetical protein